MNTKTQKTKQTQKATKQQEYLKAINYIQALTPQQLSKIKGGQYLLPPN